jgi:hypothetical protein
MSKFDTIGIACATALQTRKAQAVLLEPSTQLYYVTEFQEWPDPKYLGEELDYAGMKCRLVAHVRVIEHVEHDSHGPESVTRLDVAIDGEEYRA